MTDKEILTSVAKVSAQELNRETKNVKQEFEKHKRKINLLNTLFQKVEERGQTILLALQHEQKYSKLPTKKELSVKDPDTQEIFSNYKNGTTEEKLFYYYSQVGNLTKRAYKEIMEFRTFIVGGKQELIYNVQKGSKSYTFTEENYLNLVLDSAIPSYYNKKSLAETTKLLDNLRLQVGDPDENSNYESYVDLGRDNLYSGLKDYIKNSETLSESNLKYKSRLYELYTQMRYSFFKQTKVNEPIKDNIDFYRKNSKYSKFVWLYVDSKMDRDSVPFYKTGDAIKDKETLIENKLAGAVISVKTVKNAIESLDKNLNSAKSLSESELANYLIKQFTYVDTAKGHEFALEIQKGAADTAVSAINDLAKRVSSK